MLTKWANFQKANLTVVLFFSAILFAIYNAVDGHILQNIIEIEAENKLVSVAAYLSVGGVFGFFINLLLSLTPVGRIVDPNFERASQLLMPDKKAHLSAFASGLVAAFATSLVLWGNQQLDPSIVTILSTATIFFVAVIDSSLGFINFKKVIIPGIFVTAGAIVVAASGVSETTLTVQDVVAAIILLLVLKNVLSSSDEVLGQMGVTKSDATSFSIWRFFWLAVVGVIISLTYVLSVGKFDLYLVVVKKTLSEALPFVSATMVMVFLSGGWKNYVKKEKPITFVTMVYTFTGFFGIVITWLTNFFFPGTFANAPLNDWGLWITRIVGFALILIGLVLVAPQVESAKEKIKEKFSGN